MKSAIEMRHIATNAIKENLSSNQITQLNLIQERINEEALRGKLSCYIFEDDELYKVLHNYFIQNILISLGYKIQIQKTSVIDCKSIQHILIIW